MGFAQYQLFPQLGRGHISALVQARFVTLAGASLSRALEK
jgi:hypothetical protein